MELEILILVAFVIIIASVAYYVWQTSQGYYDNYGRKLPLDEIKAKNEQHDSEIAALKTQLAAQSKNIEGNTLDLEILHKLNELEKRLEELEKKVSG